MAIEHPVTSRSEPGTLLRTMALGFTPNWFAATMGTGIVALLLGRFDTVATLYLLGEILWAMNGAIFMLFSALYAWRWLLDGAGARSIADDPVMAMSLGTIPMGLATIANGFVLFGQVHFGAAATDIAHALWWLMSLMSLACGLVVPFWMITRQRHSLRHMTGGWLLPIVAAEVAAASGLLLLPHLPAGDQPAMLLASLVLWACSVPLVLGLVVVLVVRMIVHKLPPAAMAPSCWLALGPIGTAALGMVLLAQVAPTVLAPTTLAPLAEAMAGVGLLLGTLLWGYGLWWAGLASLITVRYFTTAPVPFNLGWWGYVFPLGVFTLTTLVLAELWNSALLGGLGLTLLTVLVGIWLLVAARTLIGVWRRTLLPPLLPRPEIEPVTARADGSA